MAGAAELEWLSRPSRGGLFGRLRAVLGRVPTWLRRRPPAPDSACPVCLQIVRADAKRCSRCGELLSFDDPLVALKRLKIAWPEPEVEVVEALPQGFGPVDPERLRLRELAEELLVSPGHAFSVLRCFADHRLAQAIERYPHQISTVRRVLGELGGRALLADEVGLGKTIEAGLVLAELRARQLCARALILMPPGLLDQWQGDLGEKLGLPVTRIDHPSDLRDPPEIGLLSIYTARGERYRTTIHQHDWDLVVVDEAHRLRNRRTQLHQFVRGIRTRRLLLLTATPIHNSLVDLYTLVNLVKPGLLGRPAVFRREFGITRGGRAIQNHQRLRSVLREAMIRNRRSTAGIALPPRHAAIQWVTLSEPEQRLYRTLTDRLRLRFGQSPSLAIGRLATAQRRLTSTPHSVRGVLDWLVDSALEQQVIDLLAQIGVGQKILALFKLCSLYPDEQILVFSEVRESVEAIAAQLASWDQSVTHWHGGMPATARHDALTDFRQGRRRILVGSDALAEGQNLQHCRVLVNFDLPWNPFRIEQRIGRVHRLGQRREVFVMSLVARDTFEADLAQLLARKLRLFELSVGELDPILGDLADSEADIERFLVRIALAESKDRERELAAFARLLEDGYLRHRELAERQELLPDLSAVGD